MDLQLTNRVAIVTGGSQGIGKACAAKLAEEASAAVELFGKTLESLSFK